MDVWVFYNDGHYGDGDVGLAGPMTGAEATKFIEERMIVRKSNEIGAYTVIMGSELEIEIKATVSKITLKPKD